MDETNHCSICMRPARLGEAHRDAVYRLVVPRQSVAVRLNGQWPDVSKDEFLSAVRPYGILRMAWAIWREVPDVAPKEALSFALRVRQKGEAEVLVTSGFLGEHVRLRLLARHHLTSWVEHLC